MPRFHVVFSQPVIDQPDHPEARRTVEGLTVNAPSASAACFHAARVTRGDGEPVAVYDKLGRLVWGAGPEAIVIPPPAEPLQDGSGEPDINMVFRP